VVDAKSPYADEHSQRVAHIARQLAADFGIDGVQLEQVEIAGLLHDIGKLRVSEDIINKQGSLTPTERATMHRHSYDTYRILQRVFDGSKIPVWAAFHHETLLGDGYPFKTETRNWIWSVVLLPLPIFSSISPRKTLSPDHESCLYSQRFTVAC
jgi:uncharacterized domain HDIG